MRMPDCGTLSIPYGTDRAFEDWCRCEAILRSDSGTDIAYLS